MAIAAARVYASESLKSNRGIRVAPMIPASVAPGRYHNESTRSSVINESADRGNESAYSRGEKPFS